jgi:hypothetical protein
LISPAIRAQVGGSSTYSFLNVTSSARVAAMGGTFISVKDNDLNLALQNPSLLNPSMSKFIAFSGVNYLDGIKFGDVAYAHDFEKLGVFDAYIHYANYGTFKQTNEIGDVTGSFKAADYSFGFGWGHQLNPLFSVGANLKGIYSDYFIEHSFGIAGDIGVTFLDTIPSFLRYLTFSLVAKNIGSQLTTYIPDIRETLPIEVQFGTSLRLGHAPIRITPTFRHLEKWDITYIDPNDASTVDLITGETQVTTYNFWQKLGRHLNLGGEIFLSKYFDLEVSYNWQRGRELSIDSKQGGVGLSYGFGLKVSKFSIYYGRATYSLAGASNHFSVSVNLGEIIKKKAPRETTE